MESYSWTLSNLSITTNLNPTSIQVESPTRNNNNDNIQYDNHRDQIRYLHGSPYPSRPRHQNNSNNPIPPLFSSGQNEEEVSLTSESLKEESNENYSDINSNLEQESNGLSSWLNNEPQFKKSSVIDSIADSIVDDSNITFGAQFTLNESLSVSCIERNRALTAPVILNESTDFKSSEKFQAIKRAYNSIEKLVFIKPENKLDLDSEENSETCKVFFSQLEKIIKIFNVKTYSREYRKSFSKAYLYLYQEESLCYLPEIFDSAQEGNPYLMVNGERYNFSSDVLDSGTSLFVTFCCLIELLTSTYDKLASTDKLIMPGQVNEILKNFLSCLSEFDKNWVVYEESYINELIVIEKQSRRFIVQAIDLEKEITAYESRAKIRNKCLINNNEYDALREKFINIIVEINKVANSEGDGRDDLTLSILTTAEKVLTQVSDEQSKSVRKLAEKIKSTFNQIRELLRSYSSNIEGIDPQLRNNSELANSLYEFEFAWVKGKKYFLNKKHYKQLLFFSQVIDVICEKYSGFAVSEQIESRDPSIFVSIPCILILKSLDGEDRDIVKEYIPDLEEGETGKIYTFLNEVKNDVYNKVGDNYIGYNLLEKFVLFDDGNKEVNEELYKYIDKDLCDNFKKGLKNLSIHLQRHTPLEWNEFLDLAMEIN